MSNYKLQLATAKNGRQYAAITAGIVYGSLISEHDTLAGAIQSANKLGYASPAISKKAKALGQAEAKKVKARESVKKALQSLDKGDLDEILESLGAVS